LALSDLEEILI